MSKIWCDLRQLLTLTANISGVDKRYCQAVNGIINYGLSCAEQKNLVNFGPLAPDN